MFRLLAAAQSTGTATLVGTITDTSDAIILGVKVAARNLGTQFVYESQTKQPQLGDPGSSYNLQSLGAFGRFGGIGRGSFSDIGTSRMHHIIVGRVEW